MADIASSTVISCVVLIDLRAPPAEPLGYALAYGAMLGECRLGEGRVLVCNLWVLDGVRRRYPEAGYLLDCLVAYAAGDASAWPLTPLSADDARALFRSEAGPARNP